jgi:hypothetical protein
MLALTSLAVTPLPFGRPAAAAKSPALVWIITKDGRSVEGQMAASAFNLMVEGKQRAVPASTVLSIHTADPASNAEAQRITAGLTAIQGMDRKGRDAAAEDLSDLGLPALSPVLASYKDTDAREPNAHYHLFSRLIPGYADSLDRTQDLVRLEDGGALRGDLLPGDIKLTVSGKSEIVPTTTIRRIAVRRKSIDRQLDLQALRHCTQIEFLDTGISLTSGSRVKQEARGWVRLDFNKDGWSSDPDGLKVPGPNYKTNLVDGFPFGALVGKVGAGGERWFAGKRLDKSGLGTGRLYLAVNDNPHWQNNIGSFRVKLQAADAYDVGDPN